MNPSLLSFFRARLRFFLLLRLSITTASVPTDTSGTSPLSPSAGVRFGGLLYDGLLYGGLLFGGLPFSGLLPTSSPPPSLGGRLSGGLLFGSLPFGGLFYDGLPFDGRLVDSLLFSGRLSEGLLPTDSPSPEWAHAEYM